ncbi:MAG: glycosyltransferase family 2 protein, partial [Myxococcota bacterium]
SPEDLACVVDSDVDLTRFDLDACCDLVQHDSGLGALWCPPMDASETLTVGDRASQATLNGSFHAFPLLSGMAPTALVGKTFVLRREVLDEVGGFSELIEYLGEDVELSSRLQAKGYRVEPAPVLARATCNGRSFSSVVARFSRWMTVLRAQRPGLMLTYPLFFFSASIIVPLGTLVSTVAFGFPAGAAAVVALSALLTRVGLVFVARARCRQTTGVLSAVIDAILGDLVLAFAFVYAYRSRTVKWRGVSLSVDRSGRLVADESP